jgi:hypothetical protein
MMAKGILKQSLEYGKKESWESEESTNASGGFSNYGFIHYVYYYYDDGDDDLNLICYKHYKCIMLLSVCVKLSSINI